MGTARPTGPGSIIAGVTTAVADFANGLAGGLFGRDRAQTNSPSTSTILQLVASTTVAVNADRVLILLAKVNPHSSPAGKVQYLLTEDNGTDPAATVDRANVQANSDDSCMTLAFEATPPSGTFIYRLYIAPSGNSGNTVINQADDPTGAGTQGFTHLWVIDAAPLSDFA